MYIQYIYNMYIQYIYTYIYIYIYRYIYIYMYMYVCIYKDFNNGLNCTLAIRFFRLTVFVLLCAAGRNDFSRNELSC